MTRRIYLPPPTAAWDRSDIVAKPFLALAVFLSALAGLYAVGVASIM